ncbi:MAG: hypothetical protein ACODAF_07295, partial [Actinomycetota bacterium]
GTRRVYFDAPETGGTWVDTPTYDRYALGAGDVVTGPAVVEEFGSTVPVHPGFAAEVDRHGNLRMGRPPARSTGHGSERHAGVSPSSRPVDRGEREVR